MDVIFYLKKFLPSFKRWLIFPPQYVNTFIDRKHFLWPPIWLLHKLSFPKIYLQRNTKSSWLHWRQNFGFFIVIQLCWFGCFCHFFLKTFGRTNKDIQVKGERDIFTQLDEKEWVCVVCLCVCERQTEKEREIRKYILTGKSSLFSTYPTHIPSALLFRLIPHSLFLSLSLSPHSTSLSISLSLTPHSTSLSHSLLFTFSLSVFIFHFLLLSLSLNYI